jgi:hypothetical protein
MKTIDSSALPVAKGTNESALPVLPILIRVPAVSTRPLSSAESARRKGRRRRLRREVRMAGTVLLLGLPLSWTILSIPWNRPATASAPKRGAAMPSAELAAADTPPLIELTLEPAAPVVPARDPQPPVALPGYVIPDDGS